jgi:hypothetical protein
MSDAPARDASPEVSIDHTVQARAEEFQRIMDEAISESHTEPAFLERLKAAGATPDKAQDYISQFSQCRKEREATGATNAGGGQPPDQVNTNTLSPVDVVTSIAWALLRAKVNHLQSPSSGAARVADGSLSDELSTLLGLSPGKGVIPASVLAKAPHLAELSAPVASDSHLEKTQELLSVFSPQHVQDILVNEAQFALVRDPLPQTFWRKILLDAYVDFEKLFASMDKGYDHHDDPKDFGVGYALVKRSKLSPSSRFVQKPIGFGSLVPGCQGWLFSFLIVMRSVETIRCSLWTCFELLWQILSSPSHLMSKFAINI